MIALDIQVYLGGWMRWMLIAALAASLMAPVSAFAQGSGPVRKPVVSVDEIKDLANTGQAAVLRQMIETTVVNTGKFRIMERNAQGQAVLLSEQQGAKAGLYTSNKPGKIGGFEGVDFKVYGTITTGGATTTNIRRGAGAMMDKVLGGPLGGVLNQSMQGTCTVSAASLAIDIRITDASTGELRYAKQITQTQHGATTCGAQSQLDLNGLIRSAAQSASMGLVTTMYPVKVVDVDGDGQILFNYGEGLLAPGEVFAVFQQGKQIIDPDTKAVLGNSESFLGLARITEVLPKMSKAVMVTAFTTPPTPGMVAREATPEQLRRLAPPAGKRR
jgi:curli biogenesis system outer membrane secretion channel CsgG